MINARIGTNRLALAALFGALLGLAGVVRGEPDGCLTLERLQQMNDCQLKALFMRSDVGRPLDGCAYGRLVYLTDRRIPKLKIRLANMVWRGKHTDGEGRFVNRWIGGIEAIGSTYTVGPSWVDGRPAVIMEYPPRTALFENMHDELREVAPGLYVGVVYERFPCPRFRGYIALQVEPCQGGQRCR